MTVPNLVGARIGAVGEFSVGQMQRVDNVKASGPGWRRLASQRVLAAIKEAEDEEALLLLLS